MLYVVNMTVIPQPIGMPCCSAQLQPSSFLVLATGPQLKAAEMENIYRQQTLRASKISSSGPDFPQTPSLRDHRYGKAITVITPSNTSPSSRQSVEMIHRT